MGKKLTYECGCVGNISTRGIFMRFVSCEEHSGLHEIIRPPSKIIEKEDI